MKVFLDSNIFLRLLVPEDETIHNQCESLFTSVANGSIIPYFSNIIILEIIYTLTRTYKFPRSKVLDWLSDVQKLRNLTIIDRSDTALAIKHFHTFNIKFGDCLIATQVPKSVTLCTYDPDFKKIPGLITKTPSQILK